MLIGWSDFVRNTEWKEIPNIKKNSKKVKMSIISCTVPLLETYPMLPLLGQYNLVRISL